VPAGGCGHHGGVADLGPTLLDAYRPGSFLFASPTETLLATGARVTVAETDPDDLVARVGKLMGEEGVPIAVGALPFDTRTAPHLVLPRSVRRAGPVHAALAGTRREPVTGSCRTTPVPSEVDFERAVGDAVRRLRAGELDKVVLARSLRVDTGGDVDLPALLRNLARVNPHGYTFAADLPHAGVGTRTLLGATPELLLRRTGNTVLTNPLAGSMPRVVGDPEADRAAADTLFASAKDRREHAVVVDHVVRTLTPFCHSLDVPTEPSLVAAPSVWHLATRITGVLADPGVSSLRLASALHPTPAVCGAPRAAANALIAELEPVDRGYYAGAVGWCAANGDGEWAVAIRCADVRPGTVRMYAGAGIMPDSDPARELAETTAKFGVLRRAMGLLD